MRSSLGVNYFFRSRCFSGECYPLSVSLCEALDLTTLSGRALAGMLAVFAEFERDILRDRVKAGNTRQVLTDTVQTGAHTLTI